VSGLVERLAAAARQRGLLEAGAAVSPATTFALVRDMPYRRASSRRPEAIIDEWCGTCSGKHYLLHGLFGELGLAGRLCLATHVFDEVATRGFPPPLRAEAVAAPVPDVHTFLRLRAPAGWMEVDATWPRGAGRLGLPVNERFVLGESMWLACTPIEIVEVPGVADPQAVKEALIARHCAGHLERRERFIEALGVWLAAA
jgi:hypothetical protein